MVDTRAANHVANHPGKFVSLNPYKGNGIIITGDDTTHPITHIENVIITTSMGQILLKDMFLVPSFKYCLLSVSQFPAKCSNVWL